MALPDEPARAKGWIGSLIERALGVVARPGSEPDFPALGVELKTIPLSRAGLPRESTFVCSAALRDIAELEWAQSGVFRKLARVLWVPIEAERGIAFAARRIGAPRLWSPSEAQRAALQADWEQLAGLLGRGDGDFVTAHLGRCLQLRPKAANARVLGWGLDERGALLRTPPRAFYLRAAFTATIFAEEGAPL
jgi:DNA mismatch repair protein MutH